MSSDNSSGPPKGPYQGSGPTQSSGPRTPGSFSGPRPPSPNYQGNRPQGATTGAPSSSYTPRPAGSTPYQPRPYQGGGGAGGSSSGGYAPRPQGAYGAPRPFTPRGTGFVKEKSKDDLRINKEINVPQVRLVGPEGEMIGVTDIAKALQMADEAGMDLVEISPMAEPPVCKILDYGKYKYEQEKKANEARKKQKVIEIKEIKVRPTIGDHDYQIKMKQARQFLGEGDKVKFSLRFKGREMSHSELGIAVMTRIKQDLEGIIRVDQEPKFEGRQVIMVVSAVKPQ